MMVQSVQDVAVRAVENHPLTPHCQWITQWPSQVVLTVAQIVWTTDVTSILAKRGGLKEYLEVCDARIQEVVGMVRGKLEHGTRLTLGALIVTYVHVTDFTWVSQMRYYWVNELVQVDMIMTRLQYGYEYLGNTSRLVITPLTDRCFRYAGRRELPDNLKVLFRTVAMMVPDYDMIAKIVLFSMGFVQADSLARKIIDTYRLCSEQLSSQHHYDYGMRAVKAVLLAANNLRLLMPDISEPQVVLRAIKDVNLPKFLAQDVPLFEGIVQDLFPTERNTTIVPDAALEASLLKTMAENNLQDVPWFREKMLQLYNMILVRHGVMVVGEPLSGKTSAYQVCVIKPQEYECQAVVGGCLPFLF
ncbi:Dynein heavy chain 3, axonemal-like 2 [Homarus americanus]|uniref:Dynein heavy chain 3, axonemal-like 2 n=1 Tax=Homarus americanus TaxID=6706 RepID=A0A8J5MVK4_HOMAM|nr:Dynein heavy chain 3, axonemal-like 2 [Homarus americanus]